jgi:putative SOS response-associated peptidase YedK
VELDAEEEWLNSEITDAAKLLPLLHPYTIAPLDIYQVSKAVNRAGYDSRDFISPLS